MMDREISRRDFLRFAGASTASVLMRRGNDWGLDNPKERGEIPQKGVASFPPRESESFEALRINPTHMSIPSLDFSHSVLKGKRTEDGVTLDVPEGGGIVDFSEAIPSGNGTLVLAGHSYWGDVPQPMEKTFRIEQDTEIIVIDEDLNPVNFYVDSRMVLNWSGTMENMREDSLENARLVLLPAYGPMSARTL